MKKIIILASIVLALCINSFAYSFSNPVNIGLASSIYMIDDGSLAPFGFEKVVYLIDTEEKGKRLWIKTFGTLDGFSFESAKTIVAFIPVGSKPDCSCTPDGLCLQPLQTQHGWICTNTCPPSCLQRMSCQ